MTAILDRRRLLSGLAALPLIGGAVTLIGRPTASAAPVTRDLLDSYNAWLFYERRLLCATLNPTHLDVVESAVPLCNEGARFHGEEWPRWHLGDTTSGPIGRASIVLSTVGCDWRQT
ncbi:hypothetical protein [Labrys monachus]|uniref:Uncharacterized protein n=1 Tax=Labrys monachus TaxID=217067 RepID=A0ABU0FM10_9HYPH|nr:hypothetical protein [Labrys monachus]MDQ0395174.1 hypothetical protein [Labrys monachus]